MYYFYLMVTILILLFFRNQTNIDVAPVVPAQKKEAHGNIARIAKRYLDDNMQQAWINPRLISMVSFDEIYLF